MSSIKKNKTSKRSSKRSLKCKTSKRKTSKRSSKRRYKTSKNNKMSGGSKRNKKGSKKSTKKRITKKMKGGAVLSENERIANGIIDTIVVNTSNLISKCQMHKETFGDLFESQSKCDLFFVNMLGKVSLIKLLMDKLPKDVAKTISPKDISTIESMINGVEVSQEVAAKFGPVLTFIIDKLYSVDNLLRLASSDAEINKKLTENKDSLELVTKHIKSILLVYFGVTPASVKFKNLAKEFAILVKFITAVNNDSNNINTKLKESLQKIGMIRLINIVIKIINNNQSGGGEENIIVGALFGIVGFILCVGFFFICLPHRHYSRRDYYIDEYDERRYDSMDYY